MFKKLIPKEGKFFEMWGQGAKILLEGAKVLSEIASNAESIKEGASRLERLEHDADVLTHDILIKLDKSFITPIDREDIHQLTLALDECMDFIEAATERRSALLQYGDVDHRRGLLLRRPGHNDLHLPRDV